MPHRSVAPLAIGSGTAAVGGLSALRDALDARGPARLVVASDGGRREVELGPAEDDVTDPTVLAVETSGSTGRPKAVLLSREALHASADAVHARLGGSGAWLLALPAYHIAGLQVLLRSLRAGRTPAMIDPGAASDPDGFAAAAASCVGERRYASLVPTQLYRLLERGGRGVEALAGFDAVLVGGAATAPRLLERARAAGVPVVATYGLTETCGGCVYDGRGLDGVRLRLSAGGRVELGGPILARGYLGRPELTAAAFAADRSGRWFRTDDRGELAGGRLRVLGRIDDAVTTGGVTVAAGDVETLLLSHPAVRAACVVGVPDDEWGEVIAAAVAVPDADVTADELRWWVQEAWGAPAAPQRVLVLDELPILGPGKPDRATIRALFGDPQVSRESRPLARDQVTTLPGAAADDRPGELRLRDLAPGRTPPGHNPAPPSDTGTRR